jgi:aminoglycoside phosphotransferase (APT) family kinase protein
VEAQFGFLSDADPPGDVALRARLKWLSRWYEFAARDVGRSPLVERALAWLEDNFPADVAASDSVLLWGDARIGNVLYHDFRPKAVLDWEQAAIGPRELDIASIIFGHRMFQQISSLAGLPGLPEVLRESDVVATYRALTGVMPGDLHWFYVYYWVVWSCAFMRTAVRRIRVGEIDKPDNIESLFLHISMLNELIGNDS